MSDARVESPKAGIGRLVQGLLYRILGRLLQKRGISGMALACFEQAARHSPGDAQALVSIGQIHFQNNRFEEAAESFQTALRRRPADPELQNRLGVALEKQWKLVEAEACYREALRLKPAYAAAHNNLGNIHRYQGRFADAEASYRAALGADPEYVEAHSNLAIALDDLKRFAEAESACREALRLRPGFAGAMNNLAGILKNQGRLDEAERTYRDALALEPLLEEAQVNLAILRGDVARLAAAESYLEQQLRRNPQLAFPNIRFGLALQAQGRYDEAQVYFEKALELEPENVSVLANLGNNLMFQADIETAIACYRKVVAAQPDTGAHQSLALYLHDLHGIAPAEIFKTHVEWARLHADHLKPDVATHANPPDPGKRIKLGYMSADFRRHSVAFFIEPILHRHAQLAFDIYCYSNVAEPDEVTSRLREIPGLQWREIRLKTHEEVAQLVCEDGIDILVDLSGHTSGSRLQVFARRPAPVQVTYLGYPDTTGLSTMDYRITDGWADPPGQTEQYHTEELVRMPKSFLAYQPLSTAPEVAPSPVERRGYVTFGSFNSAVKINRRVISLWARILHAVPASRLLLKSFAFASQKAKENFIKAFLEQGIAEGRIDVVDFVPDVANHLDLYREIDIALDPFPYNGTTTTCEALWMGVPVIALIGETHASRVGVSILNNVGLQSLLAIDEAEYLEKAVSLAGDHARLASMRQSIRKMMQESPLCDADSLTRELEASYRTMWARWCAAQTG